MAGRGRKSWAAALLALALLPAALPAAAAAAAQGPASTVRLDARLGFADLVRDGAPAPLRVLAEADRFFAGTIQVIVQGASSPVILERAVEIPGGSRKEFSFLVPRSNVIDVRAVERGGRLAGSRRPQSTSLEGAELIGVVAAGPLPARVTIPIVARDVQVVSVGDALQLGPAALRSLSHLVVDADEAGARLSPRERDAVLGFALEGGELVVAASSEGTLAFLPEAWRGTGGGPIRRIDAGDGKVTVALTALNAPSWGQNGPMWSRTIRPADLSRWQGADGTDVWFPALSSSGAFRRPTLGWLLAFLLAYVALAGPVNFIILARRGRRELAWVTVPALAVLFTVGAYVVGRGVRNVPVVQGAGVIVFDAAGERDAIALGVLSRSGGTERLSLPGEWLAEPFSFGGDVGSEPRLVLGRDASLASFKLSVGAIGSLAARRVAATPTGSAGTLNASATAFTGSVTNTSPYALEFAGVFVGGSYSPVGDLRPGETRAVTVNDQGNQLNPIEDVFMQQPFDPSQGGRTALLSVAGQVASLGEPGRAYLFGVVDLADIGSKLGIGRVGGSALLLLPLDLAMPDGGGALPFAIRRSVVATDGQLQPGSQQAFINETRETVLRFELPAGAATGTLTLSGNAEGPFGKRLIGPGRFVVPVPGAPPGVEFGGGNVGFALYDFTNARWEDVSLQDGAATVTGAGAARFVSPEREVLVRIHSDFPQTIFAGQFSLDTSA